MSYDVTQRTRELGIRLALGAQPGQVPRKVLGRAIGVALLPATRVDPSIAPQAE